MAGDAELLQRYVPFLQYDSLESYAADSVKIMTDCVPAGYKQGNTLMHRHEVLAAAAPQGGEAKLDEKFLAGEKYGDGQEVREKDHLDAVGKDYVADAREMHAKEGYANKVYGFANRHSDGELWLQYWFFYYYNDKGLLGSGLHEGDWEMVQFRIGENDEPEVAAYAQHTYGEKCDWSGVEKEGADPGPAAIVYSARGSHASYFRRGIYRQAPVIPDHNDAKGPRVRPQLEVITEEHPTWVAWPGNWGSTGHILKLPFVTYGADSPPGPRWHDAWKHPGAFYEKSKPAEELELGAAAGADLPQPAPPRIEVRREEGQATVSYQLAPPEPGQPNAKHLVLSLDGHKDGRPPATYAVAVAGASGERTLPLELGDVAYTVRAAAADRDGITGETTSAELPAN